MATFKTRERGNREDEWLSLGGASRLLGVNDSTLRRWADAGRVRTFRTPGGHRRFSLADLHRMTEPADRGSPPLDSDALQHIRERLGGAEGPPRRWLDVLTPAARRELGDLGRRTLALVARSLEPAARREELDGEALELGGRYARVLRRSALSLADAIDAFTYFRRGMDEAITGHAQEHRLPPNVAGGIWEAVSALEDRVLVGLSNGYERAGADAAQPDGAD